MTLIKKQWTIFYNCPQNNFLTNVDITTNMGLMSVLTYFAGHYAPKDSIVSIHSVEVKKDALIEFLDNNPADNVNEQSFDDMTEAERTAYHQGYYDAEQASIKQQLIDLGEWKATK